MNNRGFVAPVIVVLISVMAIGLVGAAWYYEANKDELALTNMATNIDTNNNIVVNANTNINTARVDTSDWQTYSFKSTKYGFSIDFPKTWTVRTYKINKDIDGSVLIYAEAIGTDNTDPLRIKVMTYVNSSPFDNWIEKEKIKINERFFAPDTIVENTIKIADREAQSIKTTSVISDNGDAEFIYDYYFINDGARVYKIYNSGWKKDYDKFSTEVAIIVNTFQLVGPIEINSQVDIDHSKFINWQQYGIDQNQFYYESSDIRSIIYTTFNLDGYHSKITPYGVLFWKKGPQLSMNIGEITGQYFFEGGVNPDFIWYDFESNNFTDLPFYEVQTGEKDFERIYKVVSSNSEKKLLIEVGKYNTSSDKFTPGLVEAQPDITKSIIYNITNNIFESEDPVTTYHAIRETNSTLFNSIVWDSKGNIIGAIPYGEGCGNYGVIIFVDLVLGTEEKIGNQDKLGFGGELVCNPRSGVSPDGRWIVLFGQSKEKLFDIYLFSTTNRTSAVKQLTGLIYEGDDFYTRPSNVQTWDLEGQYPVLVFNNGDVINFNNSSTNSP